MTRFVPSAGPTTMTRESARALTDEVKADAVALWEKVRLLHDSGAHHALGYASWAAYCKDEFDVGRSRAYQLLGAARVSRALSESTTVDRPRSERVARELAPALDDGPEAVQAAWDTAVGKHGPDPTAAQVRETVRGDSPDGGPVVVHARCPACGSSLPATVADAPNEPAPSWLEDPGPEPGWTPLAADRDRAERIAAEYAGINGEGTQ